MRFQTWPRNDKFVVLDRSRNKVVSEFDNLRTANEVAFQLSIRALADSVNVNRKVR